MSTQPDDEDLVLLERARTPAEAQVIAGVLKDEDIPVFVSGTMLTDEWAVSQRLLNLLGVDVMVRKREIENARRALAEARHVDPEALERQALAEAPLPEAMPRAEHLQPASKAVGPHWIWIACAAGVLAVTFLLLWLAERRHAEQQREAEFYRSEVSANGIRRYRRDTGKLAIEYLHPVLADGSYGEVRCYDPAGRLQRVAQHMRPDGSSRSIEEYYPDGTRLLWSDLDGDGSYETLEVRNAAGAVLRKLHYAPGVGFVE
jgi:Putative prokaryotic signal transducing protein